MFWRILLCITQLWDVFYESMSSSTPSQTPSSFPSDSVPSTTISQAPSSTVSNALASTSSQTPSSASFSARWDVFLNFRRIDTRFNFTGHLYQRLHDHGINTYMDDFELRGGEVISDALLDAIRNSKTYIVVFSENYATSPWCLNELAEILNCHRTMQRWVIPVFFNIHPSVIRYQTGSFQKAFKKHQKRFPGETEKLENWQLTLKEVADFSGHHISKDRSEADVINEIVDELLLKINPKTLDVAKTTFPSPSDSMISTTISQAPSSTVSNALASTSSQTPSSSAPFSPRWDVFLSLHGIDTRFTFTGHLYHKLDTNGISTFKDDPELRSGEVISDALLDAIRNSKTYIVVFSENYATSPRCLDELAEILNCHRTMQRWVIPVFFNIDLSVVRHQTGSFQKAFKKHQKRFRGEREKLENWKLTLEEVADFSGGHRVSKDRSEADVINEIVDELLRKINPKTLDVAKTTFPSPSDSMASTTISQAPSSTVSNALASTSSQTPSSSAPFSPRWDVFLSFYGLDTRLNFTGHLCQRLHDHGINTLKDDFVISDALQDAIRNSKTYIVVLSQNYAFSTWCLKELTEILYCHKTTHRLVIPVFYNIDRAVVRHQTGSFKQAFERHHVRYEIEKVNKWKHTLREVAEFSGYHISQNRSPADAINGVVDRVLLEINPMTLNVAKYPVGLETPAKSIIKLLSSDTKGVMKIGIYGIGGIGKTTLAKAVYNQIYHQFQGSCFLANVREVSATANGLVSLQQQLFYDVLKIRDVLIGNVDKGIELIRARICFRKILVVIDDLDDLKPLEYLEGTFAVGSIIIITTRNEVLLDSIKVDARYKVNELGEEESHHLFTCHAFGDNEISDTFLELSKEILEHAGGLPLALKVFGSNLANQSEQGWRWFIGLLKRRCSLTIKDKDDLLRHMGREICNVFELMASTSSQNPFSSSSYETPTRWDVFLSFRGEDTRFKFTDHLYAALDRHGIQTFKDNPDLHIGDVISDALLEAIQKSKIYIVVLSENYASSGWCLEELVAICDCYETMKRSVMPVFYNIEPSVARYQSGSYEGAFKKHQFCFAGEMQKVKNWRLALNKVSSFSGSHVSAKSSEADIVDQIVGEILLKINPKALGVAKYPVGLDSRVEGITAKLSGTEGVTKIGIYGMGGMGKTTLAKAIYNQLLRGGRFRDSCFLANVREVSASKGLVYLQQQIIDEVLKSKNKVEVYNVEGGIKVIRERICSAKLLVIIDDLNDPKQYEYLVGPFASGSVVIITTRDQEILDNIKVEPAFRYRVNMLDETESLALFTQHAFGNGKPNDTLMELSKDILRLAGGLPLALEVFGSYLSSKESVEEWNGYIEKLLRYPDRTMQQNFIISLDALESDDPMLKRVFLDIACFFIGREKGEVVKIMETYYAHVDQHINILKKRCLLTISNRDELRMHDLLRDVGRQIVRNDSPDEPGKHSRLWVSNDIHYVLKRHKGTDAIEGIIPDNFYHPNVQKRVSFTTETFKRMSKLRFLYLNNVNLTGSFEQTFEDLRWLCWEYCPLKCLPPELYPEKLVILELRRSKLRTLWDLNMPFLEDDQVIRNLRILNMSFSLYLSKTPNFTTLPCLGILNLEGCKSLEEVHESIGSLMKLVSLNLSGCAKLRSLPGSICNLRALKSLNIANCSSVKSLPRELGNIESLKELYAWGLTVSEIPDSISRLSKLVTLILRNNNNLETLPDKFGDLRALETLDFRNCCRLLSITELPPKVKWILADNCTSMERLPNLSHLKQLETFYLTNCSSLTDIQGLEELTSLRELSLGGCNSSLLAYAFREHFFQTFSGFGHQIEIYIQSEEFPDWMSQSSNLGSTVSVDMPPNVSHNFLAMILCFRLCEDTEIRLLNDLRPSYYNVQNTSSGFMLQGSFDNHNHESLMVVVPGTIFSVKDGDHRIQLTSDAEILGIHVMCNREIPKIDECNSIAANVDDDGSCHFLKG